MKSAEVSRLAFPLLKTTFERFRLIKSGYNRRLIWVNT